MKRFIIISSFSIIIRFWICTITAWAVNFIIISINFQRIAIIILRSSWFSNCKSIMSFCNYFQNRVAIYNIYSIVNPIRYIGFRVTFKFIIVRQLKIIIIICLWIVSVLNAMCCFYNCLCWIRRILFLNNFIRIIIPIIIFSKWIFFGITSIKINFIKITTFCFITQAIAVVCDLQLFFIICSFFHKIINCFNTIFCVFKIVFIAIIIRVNVVFKLCFSWIKIKFFTIFYQIQWSFVIQSSANKINFAWTFCWNTINQVFSIFNINQSVVINVVYNFIKNNFIRLFHGKIINNQATSFIF